MPLLPAGVEGLVERRVLVEPGVVLEHDRVDDSALGRRLDDLGPVLVMGREADEPRLARLAERPRRVSFSSWLLTMSIASSSECSSPSP